MEENIKIRIWLPKDEWHGCLSETIWVLKTADGRFLINNTPFFAKGISYRDDVELVEQDNELVFSRVVKPSGHASYRILLWASTTRAQFLQSWAAIEKLGCSYEESDFLKNPLFAVDVPPHVNVEKVYNLLERGEAAGVWGFEEGHFPRTNH
jgi:hypothetical protein